MGPYRFIRLPLGVVDDIDTALKAHLKHDERPISIAVVGDDFLVLVETWYVITPVLEPTRKVAERRE